MKPCYSPLTSRAACLLMALVMAGAGCAKKAGETPAGTASTATVPGEKRFPLTGEVVSANLERKTLTVTHDEIKGFMPGMTMDFKASKGDLQNAKPGQRIRAELVVRGDELSLEKIWPDDAVTTHAVTAAANALVQDTAMRGKEAYREIGEAIPDFTLLDQDGRTVSASRFRGKQVVLNFIFTRCPIATMCPAATMRMMDLQKAAAAAGAKDF